MMKKKWAGAGLAAVLSLGICMTSLAGPASDTTQVSGNAAVNEGYYEEPGGLFVLDDTIVYGKYTDRLGAYTSDLNGQNERRIIPEVYGMIVGPDKRVYYSILDGGGLRRCNLDGSGVELIYEGELKEYEGTPYHAAVSIDFADANGIQTGNGYYNIATGQMEASVEKKIPQSDSRLYKEASAELKAMIPHYDYETTSVREISGDYIKVTTYVSNSANSWMAPNDLIGEYILNTKTGDCVAYKKGKKFAPIEDGVTDLKVTEFGLIVNGKDGLYRIENGGNFVKLSDRRLNIYWDVIRGNRIYWSGENGVNFQAFEPAPLPTERVY